MHVKKGDTVQVMSGKDKGKTGEVLKSMPKVGKLLVSGINMVKKHTKKFNVQGAKLKCIL